MIEIDAFHVCEKNGQECEAPFLSRPNHQWLTQGYYFWTDSDYFAKKWGESHYENKGNDYCIMKFNLSFDKKELLDLVGNVEHKLQFLKIVKRLRKLNIIAQDAFSLKAVIYYLRKLNKDYDEAWPYYAVKAEDKRDLDLMDIPVIEGGKELISIGPTRQQLCVFENCYNFSKGGMLHE